MTQQKYTTSVRLRELFPNFRKKPKSIKLTSPQDPYYNCVAWALGDMDNWWEPFPGVFPVTYWPIARQGYAIEKYQLMLESQGYKKCVDGSHEPDVQKVVLYVKPNGEFSHIAKQTLEPSPGWSSKCGKISDIWHELPETLEGPTYGRVWGYFAK